MDVAMRENFWMVLNKGKESLSIAMDQYIKDNLKMDRLRDKVS